MEQKQLVDVLVNCHKRIGLRRKLLLLKPKKQKCRKRLQQNKYVDLTCLCQIQKLSFVFVHDMTKSIVTSYIFFPVTLFMLMWSICRCLIIYSVECDVSIH